MSLARFSAVFFASFLSLGPAFAAPAEPPRQPVALSTAAVAGAGSRTPGAALASAASRALDGNRYQEAVKLASEALKAEPGNKEAATVLHFAAGRAAAQPAAIRPEARRAAATANPVPTTVGVDPRPAQLSVRIPKSGTSVPDLSPDVQPRPYIGPGARRPAFWDRMANGVVMSFAVLVSFQSDSDRARVSSLRSQLNSIETGGEIVASLGGWEKIEKNVEIRMAYLPPGYMGMAIPLKTPDAKGHTSILFMSRSTDGIPDAVMVSVFAHELSHVRDFARGETSGGLSIPSELAAHRRQVHAFLELAARMTPAQKSIAAGNYNWEYMKFIAALWVDHILADFPDKRKFTDQFRARAVRQMAEDAYKDLVLSRVKPGTPQLDYHLNAVKGGLYTTVTDEKDILTNIETARKNGVSPSAEQLEELSRRSVMMDRADREDDEYRRAHGYQLDGAK